MSDNPPSNSDEDFKVINDFHHMLKDAAIRVEYGFSPCCDVYFRVCDERLAKSNCKFVDETGDRQTVSNKLVSINVLGR